MGVVVFDHHNNLTIISLFYFSITSRLCLMFIEASLAASKADAVNV